MKRHLAYLRYVLRHKWFVLLACRLVGASLLLGLLHDLSKFLPSEWFPYARCFYALDGSRHHIETEAFELAWGLHQKRNLHHWQAWQFDGTQPMRMPERYVREMVADWIGAGWAITGKMEVREWYARNKGKMILHPATRAMVEDLLAQLPKSVEEVKRG